MSAGLMNVLGFISWAARLPSAVFGFATVLTVYWFAKKFLNRSVAFISSLALITSVHFLYYSRASMLDVTTTAFITFSLISYYLAKHLYLSKAKKFGKTWYLWVLSGVFLGLGVMTKGVVGFLPLPIIGLYEIYLLATSQEKLTKGLIGKVLLLVLVSLAVFLPWHLNMYFKFGDSFLKNYLGYHVLDRALMAIEDKGRPFTWYFVVLKVSMRIWFIALIPAFFYGLVRSLRKSNVMVFLTIWAVFVFLFFSSAKSKLVWYIMPVYPAAVMIVGVFIDRFANWMFSLFSRFDTKLMRFMFYFVLTAFGLFYFFLNKDLVYTSDLTGAEAKLLELKDEEFGKDSMVYVDRIELPLVLYYSDSPFEIVDFGPLKERLKSAAPYEKVIFITKESRFRAYKEIHPSLRLEKRIEEWVLGELPERAEAPIPGEE
jgi:4-amino-4-deoxy-L-arabinose transferase-like glycosyltransferase